MNKTEQRLKRYRHADRWPTDESLTAMLDNQTAALFAVRQVIPLLAEAAQEAATLLAQDGSRIIYVGAGASGRLAVQDGVELYPTFSWPQDRLVYLVAGGDAALTQSIEGAEDDRDQARRVLRDCGVSENDVLIAVAASGSTPFTLEAAGAARDAGALTITFANNPGSPLLASGDHGILLDTGPEFLAGSTRMTSGTAQKIALNLLSTQIMIELGRVHDGWMVDLVPSNAKLVARAKTILQSLVGTSEREAEKLWRQANGELKVAVLIAEGADPNQARDLLRTYGGRLALAKEAVQR